MTDDLTEKAPVQLADLFAGAARARVARHIMQMSAELSLHTEQPGMMTRTYLSPAHRNAAGCLADWMTAAGMVVRHDAVGNVIGRYEAQPGNRSALTDPAPALLTGSHYDTVRNGGIYDGNLGIVLPIACIAQWHANGIRFDHAIEVIGFAEEEGVRFRSTLLGSRAVAGIFDHAVLARTDANGISMAEAINALGAAGTGLGVAAIPQAAYQPSAVLAFVEVHIEQGPVLLDEDIPVGIVTAISGARRFTVSLTGQAGHAGTVPMHLRRDAATAAAQMVLAIEAYCLTGPAPLSAGLVGTVGQLTVPHGAANVIPGAVTFSIDLRAGDEAVLSQASSDILADLHRIAASRHIGIDIQPVHHSACVLCYSLWQDKLARSVSRVGQPVRYLHSGAGHDAMAMSALAPVSMLFVRCGNGGVSHHPDEIVTETDVGIAAAVFADLFSQPVLS